MNRKTKADLENLYSGMLNESTETKKMTVGDQNLGDLPGETKKTNKGTGPESSEVKKAPDADADLQGDPKDVKASATGGTKKVEEGKSKFETLYQKVVAEALDDGDIGGQGFDDEMGDFPPAGEEEADAEMDGEFELESLGSLFRQLSDIVGKIADSYESDEGVPDDGELIDDELELEGDLSAEAVESTPAPDSTAKLQGKGNMNTNAVKVVKKAVSSASAGQENGGKPTNAKGTTLGPKTSLKSNGSGSAVDGKDASLFE